MTKLSKLSFATLGVVGAVALPLTSMACRRAEIKKEVVQPGIDAKDNPKITDLEKEIGAKNELIAKHEKTILVLKKEVAELKKTSQFELVEELEKRIFVLEKEKVELLIEDEYFTTFADKLPSEMKSNNVILPIEKLGIDAKKLLENVVEVRLIDARYEDDKGQIKVIFEAHYGKNYGDKWVEKEVTISGFKNYRRIVGDVGGDEVNGRNQQVVNPLNRYRLTKSEGRINLKLSIFYDYNLRFLVLRGLAVRSHLFDPVKSWRWRLEDDTREVRIEFINHFEPTVATYFIPEFWARHFEEAGHLEGVEQVLKGKVWEKLSD